MPSLARTRARRRAFTLIELIAVIVILGVLAALAIPTFKTVTDKSYERRIQQTLSAYAREVAALAAFHPGEPITTDDLNDALADLPTAAGEGVSAADTWDLAASEGDASTRTGEIAWDFVPGTGSGTKVGLATLVTRTGRTVYAVVEVADLTRTAAWLGDGPATGQEAVDTHDDGGTATTVPPSTTTSAPAAATACGAAAPSGTWGGPATSLSDITGAPVNHVQGGFIADAGGRVIAIGGYQPFPNAIYTETSCYNPGTDSWTALAEIPLGAIVEPLTARDSQGRIYVMPGQGYTPAYSPTATAAIRYTPDTDTWEMLADAPHGHMRGRALTDSQGRIYLVGGFDGLTHTPTTAIDRFDPATGTWSTVANFASAHILAGAVIDAQDRITIVGGDTTASGGNPVSTVERYDIATNTVVALPSLPVAVSGVENSTVLDASGQIWVLGGYSSSGAPTAQAARLDAAASSWTSLPDLPEAAARGSATEAAGTIYMVGGLGTNGTTDVARIVRWDSGTNAWVSTATSSAAGYGGVVITGRDGHPFVAGATSADGSVKTLRRLQ